MGPQSYVPVVSQPAQAVRKLLRSLSKGLARDEERRTLHITVSELLGPPVASSSAAEAITNFFQTKPYQIEMEILTITGFHRKPEKSKSCGKWISSLLVSWAEDLAQSAGGKVKVLSNHRLHIATDSYTKGVLSTLMIVAETDTLQRPRLLFIPRDHAMEKGLTYVELYALLAVALKGYHGQEMMQEIKITIFSTFSHWIQCITATIPSSYIRSILEETQQFVGDVEIRRGPCVSFLEEAGQRQILQAVVESCNMEDTSAKATIQARLPAFSNAKERKRMTDDVGIERKRQKGPNVAAELLKKEE